MPSHVRIGFSTSNAWISRAIRWFTNSSVSHAFFIYFDAAWGCDMVAEAWWTGVRDVTLAEWSKSNQLVAVFEPVVPLDAALAQHRDDLGKRYAFEGILGMAWLRICFWFGCKVKNPWHHSAAAVFCSMWDLEVLDTAHWPGSWRLDPPSTDPDDLECFVRLSGARELPLSLVAAA
jgi:hypothetical protein